MNNNNFKILDCTLRDGGYYTLWDFENELVNTYFESFNHLPVHYLELGYRSPELEGYLGEFFYCPSYLLQQIRKLSNKKLVVIINEKDIRPIHVDYLLEPCRGMIDMIRIAVDPNNFDRALFLAEEIKKRNFEIGFNVMYMSTWQENKQFLHEVSNVNGLADYFYMVDSFGGVYPEDVRMIYGIIKEKVSSKIGFHGHNNLELALINTLTAIECGVDIVDSTVTGMGRGAGNLKTELLLTVLNSKRKMEVEFNKLMQVVDSFTKLEGEYQWGTNMPYMVSGANSLPQKNVMEWVSTRYYSFNSIIRALSNQSKGLEDNRKLEKANLQSNSMELALIIGGGPSGVKHSDSVFNFLSINENIPVIHASSKNASCYNMVQNEQYFCLVGNEGYRLEKSFNSPITQKVVCLLPPFPRKMGTYIPETFEQNAYELEAVNFTDLYRDSHTALALQTAIELGVKEIFFVGYDGYGGASLSQREQELFLENEYLFNKVKELGIKATSLTPTKYKNLYQDSIYAKLM